MMSRNIGYLAAGVLLGAVLGVLICDDTKRRVREAIKNKANRLSDCASSSSKKVEEAVNNSLT